MQWVLKGFGIRASYLLAETGGGGSAGGAAGNMTAAAEMRVCFCLLHLAKIWSQTPAESTSV